jgi:hypothetical protein
VGKKSPPQRTSGGNERSGRVKELSSRGSSGAAFGIAKYFSGIITFYVENRAVAIVVDKTVPYAEKKFSVFRDGVIQHNGGNGGWRNSDRST